MSPITEDDLHRIFNNLDRNNEGRVSIKDLHHLLERVGIHAALEELEKFAGMTTLDYDHFLVFYQALAKARIADDHDHDLLKAFEVFDLNGDGYISCEELQSVLARLGLLEKRSGEDCREMIRAYDDNSDGVLDFEEFKNMMSVTPSPDSKI